MTAAFKLMVVSPPGLLDPSLAIAASRAGGLGVLDLEYSDDTQAALDALERLARFARKDFGIKLGRDSLPLLKEVLSEPPSGLRAAVLVDGATHGLQDAADGTVALGQRAGEGRVLAQQQHILLRGLPADARPEQAAELGPLLRLWQVGRGQPFLLLPQLVHHPRAGLCVDSARLEQGSAQEGRLAAVHGGDACPDRLREGGLAGQEDLTVQDRAGGARHVAGGYGVQADAALGPYRPV